MPKSKTVYQVIKSCVDSSFFLKLHKKRWFLPQRKCFRIRCFGFCGTSRKALVRNLCARSRPVQWDLWKVQHIGSARAFICFSFALYEKKACFKSYLSLISVCSVVFNITYWKNFNSSLTMKSFVILQQAFASWIVKQFWLFASSRWSSI